MKSQEAQDVFTINGIQTLSGSIYNLLPQPGAMEKLGVDILRLSPEQGDMPQVIQQFDQLRTTGKTNFRIDSGEFCNGY